MSGPLPIAAAVAVLGRRSSQLSLVTMTSTPVASVNFLLFSRNRVSSPWTNLEGRSTRREAPCSISNLGGATSLTAICARRPPLASMVVPASAPAPRCSASRLVNKVMPVSLFIGRSENGFLSHHPAPTQYPAQPTGAAGTPRFYCKRM